MRYLVTNQQINFYVEHGYIEFEELLFDLEIENYRKEFDRLVKNLDQKTVYLQGRDLWRESDLFKKIAKNKQLASIVDQLTSKSRLRLAFDQISTQSFSTTEPFGSFFCFKKLACIVVFYFDSKANTCAFINPKHPFVAKDDSHHLYLIGYAQNNALYISNPKDLNTHYLKKFGYSFNEFLKEKFHPIISR